MKTLYLLLFCCVFTSCKDAVKSNNTITGLWKVSKVQVGTNEMTPIARWMQFNKDSTQISGNGWLKHSEGTWKLQRNLLTVSNTNGLLDEAAPFSIDINDSEMTWFRTEEGQNVKVFLERAVKRPTSPGNQLMGLWKLLNISIANKDITLNENPKNNQTLYLSWDNVFREHNLPSGKRVGVYKIHAHKPELQMVNYGKEPQFSFWKFSITKNNLVLTSRDKNIVKKYKRIYKFLQ